MENDKPYKFLQVVDADDADDAFEGSIALG
jgi:hypothetical protein